jgi:hypothetical protein
MTRKDHVRFCTGGGAGDCPADRNLGGFYHSFALSSCANNIRLLFQWAAVLCIGHGAI